jgi:hypothetical protein
MDTGHGELLAILRMGGMLVVRTDDVCEGMMRNDRKACQGEYRHKRYHPSQYVHRILPHGKGSSENLDGSKIDEALMSKL